MENEKQILEKKVKIMDQNKTSFVRQRVGFNARISTHRAEQARSLDFKILPDFVEHFII
jgi:hypothetical protein